VLRNITTTYGRPALEVLRTLVGEAKAGDPMAPVVVLAPTQVAGTVARRHLARYGLPDATRPGGIAGIEITTIARLAERMAAGTLAPRRPVTRPILAAAWRNALNAETSIFADVAEHPATIRALVAAHRELRGLDPQDLDVIAAASTVARDTVRLHRQVHAELAPRWYDTRDLLDTARDHAATHGLQHTPVVLYLPQDLTAPELDFVRAIAETGEVTVVEARTGVKRADERATQVTSADEPSSDVVTVPTGSGIFDASDSDDEVRCVVRDVVRTLRTTRAERVAVLYGAREPYARLLHEHFAAAGIRVNGPGTRPVVERAVSRAILGILALGKDDVPRGALFRALADAPIHDFRGGRAPVSRWERTSREAGVVRGDDWDHRLGRFIATEEARAAAALTDDRPHVHAAAGRRAETGSELREFTLRLRAELHAASEARTWAELSQWAAALVDALLGADLTRLPPEEQHAAAALRSVLEGLDVLDEMDSVPSLAALLEILEAELSEALPRVGRFGDGLLVAPVAEAVGLDLDVVHVVGLSEDVYPGRPHADALLPDWVRQTADGRLPTSRDRLNRKYRHLLAAFAAAPTSIASFPRGDLRRSSLRLPSRWLLGTLRELSGDKQLAATDWATVGDLGGALRTSGSFAGELLRTPDLATDQEWRTRTALAGALDDAVVDAAQLMLHARAGAVLTRFDGDLTGVDGLPDYRDVDRFISPTALEGYATCPHTFLVGRLLGVNPLEQPEDLVTISPADLGTLIHRCLDELVQSYAEDLPGPGAPWPPESRARLVEILHRLGRDAEADGLTGHPRLWRRERDRVEADLLAMLDADDQWRAQTMARVAASEMPFGTGDQPPVEVPVTGGTVRMRGSADKVDIGATGTIYVTDVKTGSRRSFAGITQDDPLAGASKLQLPVYGWAARQRFGQPDSPVRAGYWFVRKDPGRVDLDITPGVDEALAATVDVLVRSIAGGLFPQRPPQSADFAYVQCQYCNPDGIGHTANRERWERQRHDPKLGELVALLEPDALTTEPEVHE